jgi:hypothetical protein
VGRRVNMIADASHSSGATYEYPYRQLSEP